MEASKAEKRIGGGQINGKNDWFTKNNATIYRLDEEEGSTDLTRASQKLEIYVPPLGTIADRALEYTQAQDFALQKYKPTQTRIHIQFTDRLIRTFDAINLLQLTENEQTRILQGSPNRNAWSLLRNIEFGRALMFSPNFQTMIQEHQKALLNYWGLDVGHTATCLTIPNE